MGLDGWRPARPGYSAAAAVCRGGYRRPWYGEVSTLHDNVLNTHLPLMRIIKTELKGVTVLPGWYPSLGTGTGEGAGREAGGWWLFVSARHGLLAPGRRGFWLARPVFFLLCPSHLSRPVNAACWGSVLASDKEKKVKEEKKSACYQSVLKYVVCSTSQMRHVITGWK